ncbi:MAG: ATP synthase subunit I [Thiobacillus sp.]|nr:ATP synthase subunit I [Thiobacillus sp.]
MRPGSNTGIRRVAWTQAVLLLPGALAGVVLENVETGMAVGYGILVALSTSLVLWRRERQAMRHPEWDQHRLFRLFILTGFERLVVLVALLAIGMAILRLSPLPQLLGLLLAQLAWLAAARR